MSGITPPPQSSSNIPSPLLGAGRRSGAVFFTLAVGACSLGCSAEAGDGMEPYPLGGWGGTAGSGAAGIGTALGAGMGGTPSSGGVQSLAGSSALPAGFGGTPAAGADTSSAGTPSGGSATGGVSGTAGSGGTPAAGGANAMGGSAGRANGGQAGASGGSAGAPNGGSGGAPVCMDGPVPEPPAEMKETIDITWKEMTGGFSGKAGARGNNTIQSYRNWALDQVMTGKGTLNFCVRWDSEEPVSTMLRDQIDDALQRGVDAWFDALTNYDCFPYPRIAAKISGWATRNRATFQWTDDDFVPLFINQLSNGAPDCPDVCSRQVHTQASYQFPNCPGGFANRFDQEVWLGEDYNSPNGWAWGQHVNREGFTNRVTGALYHIWLHEFGHGIGFPDYYDWSVWAPGVAAPRCVMNAGAATTVTDWDKWMFKRTWSELRRTGRWP